MEIWQHAYHDKRMNEEHEDARFVWIVNEPKMEEAEKSNLGFVVSPFLFETERAIQRVSQPREN